MTQPKRRALMKPFELLGISAVMAGFVLLILLLTTQDFMLGLIFAGVAFIVAILVFAMLVLSYSPNPDTEIYLDRFENAEQGVARSDEVKLTASASASAAQPSAGQEPVAATDAPASTRAAVPDTDTAADTGEAPHDEPTSGEAPTSK